MKNELHFDLGVSKIPRNENLMSEPEAVRNTHRHCHRYIFIFFGKRRAILTFEIVTFPMFHTFRSFVAVEIRFFCSFFVFFCRQADWQRSQFFVSNDILPSLSTLFLVVFGSKVPLLHPKWTIFL